MKVIKLIIFICSLHIVAFGQLTVSVIQQHPSCPDYFNGVAAFGVSGGTPPYSYSLSPLSGVIDGNFNQIIHLPAGSYSFTATDQNSVSATNTFVISQTPSPSVSITYTSPACNLCNATAFANVTGGSPPYRFLWNQGPAAPSTLTTQTVYNLCPTNNYVDVVDAMGCWAFNSVVIPMGANSLTGLTVSVNKINDNCGFSGTGSIDLSLSGSNPGPFTYYWNNGAISQDIYNLHSGNYNVSISDPSLNCLTVTDSIIQDSTTCGYIIGRVFFDIDSNCVFDFSDFNMANQQILINPGNIISYTDSYGYYVVNNLAFGTYTVTPFVNSFVLNCATSITVTLDSINKYSYGNDFAFKSNSISQPDISVSASTNGIVPGFSCHINYNLCNLNNFPTNGFFKVTLPSVILSTITGAIPSNYTISGDTIIWNYSSLFYSGGCNSFRVDFITPVSLPLGSTFTTCMFGSTSSIDIDLTNNISCYDRIVTGAFDPNDKSVSPVGDGPEGNITENDKELTYLVRFQNTGNGVAYNVFIKDTISSYFDMLSFQVLDASHNYNIELSGGNIITLRFNGIMLPDSSSDEPGSHGYIHYKIKQKANNPIGSKIKNTAYIYFDFNEAVITNSTLNTIVAPTGINDITNVNDAWHLFPNPSSGLVYLENNSKEDRGKSEFQVINSIGEMVYKELIDANNKILDLSKYNSGVYFVRIVSDKQTVVKRFVLNK